MGTTAQTSARLVRWLTIIAISFAAGSSQAQTKPFQTFEDCRYIETEWADGDSFLVEFPDGEQHTLRLYHVDCMETMASQDSDKRRIREQGNYYGIDDLRLIVDAGRAAKIFVQEKLKQPFTVHTSFSKALGRSAKPRFSAYIHTADNQSLDELLVAKGLARPTSIQRSTPDGKSAKERNAELEDCEIVAAIKRVGLWQHCDPDKLLKLRETDREEARRLAAVDAVFEVPPPDEPVDVNTATLEQLESTGLRSDLADLVIQMRPFQSIDQLIDVKGIGPKTLEKVRPFVRIDD
jgi:competence protein ComEA